MKSAGPWNLRGLRPEAREAARAAARQAGMSVGEWLNSVIQSGEQDDDTEAALFSDLDDEAQHEAPGYSRPDSRERRPTRDNRRDGRHDRDFEPERPSDRKELDAVYSRIDRLSSQLERMAQGQVGSRRQAPPRKPAPSGQERKARLTGAPARNLGSAGAATSVDSAVAEIAARQRALDGNENDLEMTLVPAHEPPAIDLNNLEQQLRHITTRIEALQPSADLEAAVAAIRTDLTEIAGLITGALPRRAVESLEIEVKALAERIEHSRRCGVDTTAIAGLERGLSEVRDALRNLTPAESLVGFDDAVKALSQKVDAIVAKDDPAALQQLEAAIGGLRGIVSHVASNETLTKVAEEVRSLSAKMDTLAASAASSQGLSALENRIETLANALTASAEAGHAVPRELEKLLSGLIEKLEWVQLTHTDHAALAHLEDRIATLVQRFDASDARLGHLEAIERGIADLLVHLEQMRGAGGSLASHAPMPSETIERDVAEIKQSELRTQDSLEAVQGTVEHVVDRLAMIESGIRETTAHPAPAPQQDEIEPAMSPAEEAPFSTATLPAAVPPTPAAKPKPADAVPARPAAASRTPIDPNLPPDHPLEPGSATGRAKPTASASDRIAASEAAVGSTKPPVIDDAAGRPNFIAAARRAAQAAAFTIEQADDKTAGKGATKSAKPKQRARPLIIAGAAALIVLGFIQITSRFFESSSSGPVPAPNPAPQEQTSQSPPAALPEPDRPAPPPAEPQGLPVPVLPPAMTVPSPLPSPKSGGASGTKPVHQSSIHDDSQQTGPIALAPNADVTGSLPHAATSPVAASFGDKLPATIGGPALRAAALSGDPAASYEVAMRFADGRGVAANNAEAALWLERAAKQGLAPAQFRLGGLYEKGLGVKKDLAAARDLYLAAGKKGNGKAMHNLAVLYAEGVDGSPDYTDAAHWFREASDHGITDSQYNLGILYARGIGVAQNFAESYKWFSLAADQGDADAAKKRDEVAGHLDQQSLAAARLAAMTWTAAPQPEDAISVKAPPGGWDTAQAAAAAPAAKPKPHPPGGKVPAADIKTN
jgi:localization factor PodJL